MTRYDGLSAERASLLDAIDHLLNRGVVLAGETTLSLAGVDLVYLGLNVVLASVETLEAPLPSPAGPHPPAPFPKGKGEHGARSSPVAPSPLGEGVGGEVRPALRPPSPATYSGSEHIDPAGSPPGDSPVVLPLTGLPERLPASPEERPEVGLARLVLALVELLRQLLERQAVRRMEGERLSDDQVERMGLALRDLEAKMAELRAVFGLTEEDLNLDLGPLGRLLG